MSYATTSKCGTTIGANCEGMPRLNRSACFRPRFGLRSMIAVLGVLLWAAGAITFLPVADDAAVNDVQRSHHTEQPASGELAARNAGAGLRDHAS